VRRQPSRLIGINAPHVDVEVILAFAVPRENDLFTVRRKVRAEL
jgi:hypothetical protein